MIVNYISVKLIGSSTKFENINNTSTKIKQTSPQNSVKECFYQKCLAHQKYLNHISSQYYANVT